MATDAEITAYVAEQNANPIDLRDCELTGADGSVNGEEVNVGDVSKRARVRVPKSGWALKKFDGVKEWIDSYTTNTDDHW